MRPGAGSWPIAATVFVLMERSLDADAQPKSQAALRFFRWVFAEGQADARKLDYVPLPAQLVEQIEGYWAQNIR